MPSDPNEPLVPGSDPGDPNPPPHSGSGDDLSLSLAAAQPDPFLAPAPPLSSSDDLGLRLRQGRPDPWLGACGRPTPVAPAEPGPAGVGRPEPEPNLGGIVLDAPQPARPVAPSGDRDDGETDDGEPPRRGLSLPVVLLASYASAVTLGLVWVLLSGRRMPDRPARVDAAEEASAPADPGYRADRSRRVVPPAPIPGSNLAALGETVRLGDLEVTPLAIADGPVNLERTVGTKPARKGGGSHAWKLKLRLRNLSRDAEFAPLDEAFVRQRLRADPESFVTAEGGGTTLDMYPLAVESEWSVVGQSFRELRPGQRFETTVVSEPGATGKLAGALTWRVRLRTGIATTADLGVRFRPEEVRVELPEPSHTR